MQWCHSPPRRRVRHGHGAEVNAGAAARLPVARVANIGQAVRALKKENVFVYCADMGGPSAFGQNLRGPDALVAGSEGAGVSQLVKKSV